MASSLGGHAPERYPESASPPVVNRVIRSQPSPAGTTPQGLDTPGASDENSPAGRGTAPQARGGPPTGLGRGGRHGNSPRRRGEDGDQVAWHPHVQGTAPQARGGPCRWGSGPSRGRNSPAGAGRTHCSLERVTRDREQPRRRGEDMIVCRQARERREQPRRRGEDGSAARRPQPGSGTAPQARGGRCFPDWRTRAGGNSPAGAGRTPMGWAEKKHDGEQPRRRGEDAS